ncbi:MAG: response regulator [Alphaproteobacteria bacterium]
MSDQDRRDIVMVVDDAPETLNLLIDILDRSSMTALVARSAENALSLLDRIAPDIILMDAVMPEIDGFKACEHIKAQAEFANIPVIFMTGLTETEHVLKAFDVGGVDYVTKPVSPDEIVARIRAHLNASRDVESARKALDVSGRTLTAINADGDILWSTPQASALITALVDEPISAHGDAITDAETWLQPRLLEIVQKRSTEVTILESSRGRLKASYLGQANQGEYLLSLRDGQGPRDDEILSQTFGLTAREAEVLLWIAQGKSNRDIGTILNFSHRTVNKHLEQIFAKLSVENRTGAAAKAVRVLAQT